MSRHVKKLRGGRAKPVVTEICLCDRKNNSFGKDNSYCTWPHDVARRITGGHGRRVSNRELEAFAAKGKK